MNTILRNASISEYILNVKKNAEDSWISADIIQEHIEKGEKFGR